MPAENFLKTRHGFCFSEILYGISLQKVVCSQHSPHIHPLASPSSRAAYADMQKADQKGAGLHPAESVGWGYDSLVQSEYMMCVLCQL